MAFRRTTPLKEGDIVSLDMAATYQGFVGDTAMTVPVGKISDELKQLIRVTDECLQLGIRAVPREQSRRRHRLGSAGARREIRLRNRSRLHRTRNRPCDARITADTELRPCGNKREDSSRLLFRDRADAEPRHASRRERLSDKWTVVTLDGKASAHAEHTIAVTPDGPEILTLTREQKAALVEGLSVLKVSGNLKYCVITVNINGLSI